MAKSYSALELVLKNVPAIVFRAGIEFCCLQQIDTQKHVTNNTHTREQRTKSHSTART